MSRKRVPSRRGGVFKIRTDEQTNRPTMENRAVRRSAKQAGSGVNSWKVVR